MVWRAKIETTSSEKEDKNNQEYYQSHYISPCSATNLFAVRSKKRCPALTGPLVATSAVDSSRWPGRFAWRADCECCCATLACSVPFAASPLARLSAAARCELAAFWWSSVAFLCSVVAMVIPSAVSAGNSLPYGRPSSVEPKL